MKTKLCRSLALLVSTGLASVVFAGCSANPERFQNKLEEETNASRQAKDGQRVPPPEPLKLREGEPEVEPMGEIETTRAFKVGDLLVIHKQTTANTVVSARLYVDGGSANLTGDTSGIEQLAMQVAVSGGTESTPKDEFNSRLDSTGSAVYAFNDRDYSGYGLKTLVDHFDDSWELFVQAVMEPAMPKDEVEIQRAKQIASIEGMLEDPDSHVSYVAARTMFQGHPYYHLQIGEIESVRSFERNELFGYQRALLDPQRMILVIVGNLDAQRITEKVKRSFGRLLPLEGQVAELAPFASEPTVEIVNRQLPTNYVLGYFTAPPPGHPDYPAMLVAAKYLRDRLFEEVRTKRNLTYAVSAGISNKKTNYGYLYVTAVDPKTTMKVIFDQIAEIKLIEIPKAELDETRNVFITDYYMDLETNGSQASMLAQSQIVAGDWRRAEQLLDEIRKVTSADVQRVANEYFNNYRFGVVGPPGQVEPSFFQPQ